jgi:hypothetical protein
METAKETKNITTIENSQKLDEIQKNYDNGSISDKEATAGIKKIIWETELLDYIVIVHSLISYCFILFLSFIVGIILINILIFTIQKLSISFDLINEISNEVIKWSPMALSSLTLNLFPVFIIAIISRILVFYINKENNIEKNK